MIYFERLQSQRSCVRSKNTGVNHPAEILPLLVVSVKRSIRCRRHSLLLLLFSLLPYPSLESIGYCIRAEGIWSHWVVTQSVLLRRVAVWYIVL